MVGPIHFSKIYNENAKLEICEFENNLPTHNGMFGWQNLGTRFWVIKIQISYLDSLKMIKGLDLTNTSKILTLKIRGINMG